MNLFLNRCTDFLRSKRFYTLVVLLLIIIGARLFIFSIVSKEDDKNYHRYFQDNYKIFSIKIPENLSFANEPVPLHDFDFHERIDRELTVNTYWQSNTSFFHKRAHRWFPVIEPILKKNGIPDDFKYLAMIESGLTNIVSPAGATGFWQLMEEPAKKYGLQIDKEIDERYNVEKSTEAACKYLHEAYSIFGNWTMAAASYNMGMNGAQRQLEKQKVNNYYDLLLGEETSRYLFRILAAKCIMEHPQDYGFYLRKKDLYPPFKTHEITLDTAVVDFTDFAITNKVNYKILKMFNPWLRQSFLTNKERKKYTIKLPVEGYTDFEKLLDSDEGRAIDSVYTIDLLSDTISKIESR